MIDGIWWLVILLAVGVALWLLAKARQGQDGDIKQRFVVHHSVTKPSITKKSIHKKSVYKKSLSKKVMSKEKIAKEKITKEPDNEYTASLWTKLFPKDALQKTALLLKLCFPEYQVARKRKHLLISKQGKKVAMITVDKKIAVGQRRLGDIPVINYHRAPSRAQLMATLKRA